MRNIQYGKYYVLYTGVTKWARVAGRRGGVSVRIQTRGSGSIRGAGKYINRELCILTSTNIFLSYFKAKCRLQTKIQITFFETWKMSFLCVCVGGRLLQHDPPPARASYGEATDCPRDTIRRSTPLTVRKSNMGSDVLKY